jgi:hypothetical protein
VDPVLGSPANRWMLDEVAHAGAEHLEPGYAESFDQKSPTD